MHLLPKSRSLLCMLVSCMFFSCEQLIEIIKPTPPKPVEETCRLVEINFSESGFSTQYTYDSKGRLLKETTSTGSYTEYTYDQMGRVVKQSNSLGSFIDYTYDDKGRLVKRVHDSNNGDPAEFRLTTETYTYNEQNQLIEYSLSFRTGIQTSYEYDAQGRVTKVNTQNDQFFDYDPITEYRYEGNTVTVKTTATHEFEETKTSQTTYVFEDGNLVKMRIDKSENGDSDGYEITYKYSSDLDKLSIPRIVLPEDVTADLFTSKNLRLNSLDNQGVLTTYEWQLNKQGYPVKRIVTSSSSSSQTLYEYSCEAN